MSSFSRNSRQETLTRQKQPFEIRWPCNEHDIYSGMGDSMILSSTLLTLRPLIIVGVGFYKQIPFAIKWGATQWILIPRCLENQKLNPKPCQSV
jgi:uncharacterized FAD-dependent dehydrogenase